MSHKNKCVQELNLIKDLELEDKLVRMDQYEDFAKVIRTMVQHYVDKVSTHVPQYIGDLKTVSWPEASTA